MNKEEELRCHPSLSGSSERSTGRVGRAAGATAVASDAAPGPHHRRPRTEPAATSTPRYIANLFQNRTPNNAPGAGGGQDTVLCTSDPYWTTVTTDRYLPDRVMQNALGC
ncbi:unnamed protein product [Arctia plantaginis]|uniref:Uncharacterized protein n=1 Tax=Arctia plantaginis TaxID=874455 RepID=A0A8S1A7U8_ARCPL|nr:unnamed protein product [Arctia plantaginis]CAB3240608.1 unnamed protein product [Arctia plantaginis]